MPKKAKIKFPMHIFIRQLKEIMREQGFDNPDQLSKDLGMNVIRWFPAKKEAIKVKKTKTSSVELDSIMLIANKYNKSLDWLIYGKEPVLGLAEVSGETYESNQPALVDLLLISHVAASVHKYLNQTRLKIGPNRFGQIISMGYEQCITDHISPEDVDTKKHLELTRLIKD